MGPEGRIRTGISVVDSDALYRLSYLEAVREMKRVHAHQRKTLFQPRPHARGVRCQVRDRSRMHSHVEVALSSSPQPNDWNPFFGNAGVPV